MQSSIMNSETFFFISSIGFVTLWVLVGILLFYLIRATRTFERILHRAEKDIDNIGDTTKEMLEDVRESAFFGFLFRKKKKSRK